MTLATDRDVLLSCCASTAWVDLVQAASPYADLDDLLATGARAWDAVDAEDWLEALAAHPRIGDRPPAGSQEAREQAAAVGADPAVLAEIAALNATYGERFARTYVVRAAGRSADEMLAMLRERLTAEPADELVTAAGQQWEITALRLRSAYAA